ncbi:transposase-like protein [Mucilaginibacter gracilis]|uniref:Transposase-like protein n=1 Tax=Mucilaginibacter gracilis TaxID=423350 RepID=A0A495J656_9SPHI|nr:IS1595 family transposase [Mucilaginibacter gracilis]RKR83479.1 transposase-like protein [Mucilaginibacter gracilis]
MEATGKTLPFKTINDIAIYFQEQKTCINYLIKLRWPNGVECPFCDHKKVYNIQGAKPHFKCAACRKHFSALKGSIFENSAIPLSKWFMAIYILSTHKKGISSIQVGRDIGVRQKTAWFMMQRIRYAVKMQSFNRDKLGLTGVVEMDESYIGGKQANMHKKKLAKILESGEQQKLTIAGAIERGGEVRAQYIPKTNYEHIIPFLIKNVHQGTKLMTDEHSVYTTAKRLFKHKTIKHMLKEYVRGDVHTNTIENFWSVLKRGIYGTYHFITVKHVQNYLEEFAFRFNNRNITEAQRFDKLVSLSNHRITYKALTDHGQKESKSSKPANP